MVLWLKRVLWISRVNRNNLHMISATTTTTTEAAITTTARKYDWNKSIRLSAHYHSYWYSYSFHFKMFHTALSCADGASNYCGISANICSGKSCVCGSTGTSCVTAILSYCRNPTTATYTVSDSTSTCQVYMKKLELVEN